MPDKRLTRRLWANGLKAWSCALALLAFGAAAQGSQDLRIALVIGNSAYVGAPLPNPVNDARAMADTLRGLGFVVMEVHDANKALMEEAIARIRDSLKGKQAVGMLYYAGHGLQVDWRNYMVPVDAKIATASDVPAQAVDVSRVIEAFSAAGNRMNIVVLDACRDNPFGGIASGKGLAQFDAPPGTFLAYATAPGNVAEDGDVKSGNGLYTQFLLQELKKPTAKIEEVFKRVRFSVRRQSQGRQIPWESTSLEDDFVFNSGIRPAVRMDDKTRTATFNVQLADWERIKHSKQVDDFYAYLQKYPSGFISEQAQFRLDQLAKTSIVAQPSPSSIAVLPNSSARYRVGDVLVYRETDVYGTSLPDRKLLVTAAGDGKVELNNGADVWDEMGNLVKDVAGLRTPAKGYFPAELAPGKRWRSAYEISRGLGRAVSLFWDFQVIGLEEVTVPEGTLRAFRIEGASWTEYGEYQTETYWIDPTRMIMVKDQWLRRDRSNAITGSYVRELVSYGRSPRS